MALARVAAQCSIAYSAFMQAAAPVLAAGTLDQVKAFNYGMQIMRELSQVDQTSEAIEAQPQAAAPKQSRRALKLGKGRSHYNTQSLFEHVCFAANIRNSKRIGVVLGTALNLATGKYMDSLQAAKADFTIEPAAAPSAATLSRAKCLLDAFLMECRQGQWARWGFVGANARWIALSHAAAALSAQGPRTTISVFNPDFSLHWMPAWEALENYCACHGELRESKDPACSTIDASAWTHEDPKEELEDGRWPKRILRIPSIKEDLHELSCVHQP